MSTRSRKKKSVYRVDLSDVQDNTPPPEGSYHLSVASVEAKEGDEDTYFAWKFNIESGKYKGKVLYTNTSLAPQSLWNLRGLLEAMEVEIPDEAFDLDLDEIVGGECMGSVDHEEYRGKPKARLTDFWPMEDEKPKGKRSKKDEEEDEVQKKRSRRKADEDEDEEEPPKRSRRKPKDEDEDEEEDEPPKRSSKKGSKKAAEPPSQAEIKDMSQDELEDVIKEFELDVDLSDFKTLRKMQLAVVDAIDS